MADLARCPSCSHAAAEKVRFTAWGGVIGPRVLSLVKCTGCGAHYNGRSGRTVEKAIRLYTTVTFGLLILLAAFVIYIYASGTHVHAKRPTAAQPAPAISA